MLIRLWLQLAVPALVRRVGIDVVHHTKGLGCLATGCKTVLTIYDLADIVLARTVSRIDSWYWRVIQPVVANRADWIITGSEDVKRDIVRFLGVGEGRIRVIPFGVSPVFGWETGSDEISRVRSKYSLPDDYVLFVGNLNRKKNLATLVRAYSILRERNAIRHALVVVGGRYRRSDDTVVKDLVQELGLGDMVVFTGSVPDDELVALYRGAQVFVFPSLHEGFGLAPLEAMACGVPVVSSMAGSLREVLGDAAYALRNPLDEGEMALAILRVLNDAEVRAELTRKGLDLVQQYSWPTTARETLKLYHEAFKGET